MKIGTDTGIHRCYLVQVLLIFLTVISMFIMQGTELASAAVYGGGITLFNTWLLARRVRRAVSSEQLVIHGQVGVIERLLVAGVMITVGFVVLGLSPLGLIAGLFVPYLGFLFAYRSTGKVPSDSDRIVSEGVEK